MQKALIVGVNSKVKKGAINDAQMVSTFLYKKGFSVKRLFGEKATLSTIMKSLDELVNSTKPGDLITFHYSGPGTQLINRSKNGKGIKSKSKVKTKAKVKA